MVRIILTVLVTLVVLLFVLQNFVAVPISFLTFGPIQVRLVFVILSSLVIGAMIPVFYRLVRRMKTRKIESKGREIEAIFEEDD